MVLEEIDGGYIDDGFFEYEFDDFTIIVDEVEYFLNNKLNRVEK